MKTRRAKETMEKNERDSSTVFALSKGIRYHFVLALLFVAIETAFEVVIPLLMADIIDLGILKRDVSIIYSRGFYMIICALGSQLFGWLYAKSAARASARLASQIRVRLFEKIEEFSFENIDHYETSGLVTRLTSDVSVLQNTITSGIRPIARGPLMLILGLIMCFAISPSLSLVFLLVIPVLLAIILFVISKVAPQYRLIQSGVDTLNEVVEENLIAIRLVKSFVRKDVELKRFDAINEQLASLMERSNHFAFLNLPVFQGSMYIVILLLLGIGSSMIMQESMEVGQLTGLLSYVLQIMNSFILMSNVFLLIVRSLASVHRIEDVLQE